MPPLARQGISMTWAYELNKIDAYRTLTTKGTALSNVFFHNQKLKLLFTNQ
jgi:hypothetical protein